MEVMGPERVFPSSDDEVRDEDRFPTPTAWSGGEEGEEGEEPNAAGGGVYHYQPLNQEPINDDEEEPETDVQTVHQRIEVMGLHLPEAPPPDPEDDNRDLAEAQRSHASIPMDADHVELVKQTMASVSFPSLGIPAWAQQISEDQWRDMVQTTIQNRTLCKKN